MKIRYLDGRRLRRSLVAAADWVEAGREDLNRINVFPVPDGDTGTNFTLTLRAVADSVGTTDNADLSAVSHQMARACILGAHGNSGMLLSQFLIGFRDEIGDRLTAEVPDVARAMRQGFERLYAALDQPIEGTILTICREVAEAAEETARRTNDLRVLLQEVLRRSRVALEHTPDLLESLREAGVVDAGGKGFVRLLEGIMRLVDGQPTVTKERADPGGPAAAATAHVEADRDYQFCTEVLVRGDDLPATTTVRERLRDLGGSIVVLKTDDLLKVHVHTNEPDRLFALAAAWGTVEATKADDMREQHAALHVAEQELAVVVDSSCDLCEELIARHRIIMVPMQIIEGSTRYRDRIDIGGADIYERMQQEKISFSTSQPTPAAFHEAFTDATAQAERALCLSVSGKLSGTYNSARSVAEDPGFTRVTVFDSRTVSLGLGLLAIRARELAEEGARTEEIVCELERIRNQSGLFVTFDTFEHIVRSGRLGRAKGWLGSLLDLKPIMAIDRHGEVEPVDRVRGRDAVLPRMLELLDDALTPRPQRLRMAVVHAHAPEVAERVAQACRSRFDPYEMHIGHVAAVIGVHTGPGAWAVIYQNEDPDRAA